MTIPFEFGSNHHYNIRNDLGSLDRRIGEQGSSDEKEARFKDKTFRSHWGERSISNRHCGELSCMGVNFPSRSRNQNHGFTEGLHVSVRIIVG
jgi:hypothetical protein